MVTLEQMSIWYQQSGANFRESGGTIFDSSWLLLVVMICRLIDTTNVRYALGAFLEERLPFYIIWNIEYII